MDRFVAILTGLSRLPGSEWHLAAPSVPSLLMFYACLAALWIGSNRSRTVWIAGTGLVLLFGWWMWSPRLWLDGDRFRITFSMSHKAIVRCSNCLTVRW